MTRFVLSSETLTRTKVYFSSSFWNNLNTYKNVFYPICQGVITTKLCFSELSIYRILIHRRMKTEISEKCQNFFRDCNLICNSLQKPIQPPNSSHSSWEKHWQLSPVKGSKRSQYHFSTLHFLTFTICVKLQVHW